MINFQESNESYYKKRENSYLQLGIGEVWIQLSGNLLQQFIKIVTQDKKKEKEKRKLRREN